MINHDDQLIRQAQRGDQEAFRQLVDQYKAYVFAIVLRFIKEHQEAENVAQEVFLQVYRSLPQYRFQGLKPWLGKIAVTKAVNWHRTRIRSPLQAEVPVNEEIPARQDLAGPEEIYLRKERQEKVRTVCRELPEVYRRTVVKFYLEEKSQQQIALEEATTVKTIESRLYRARQIFREKWGEQDGG